jgi:hypothetical protein
MPRTAAGSGNYPRTSAEGLQWPHRRATREPRRGATVVGASEMATDVVVGLAVIPGLRGEALSGADRRGRGLMMGPAGGFPVRPRSAGRAQRARRPHLARRRPADAGVVAQLPAWSPA